MAGLSNNGDEANAVEVSGRVMMAAIVVLFVVVIFILCIHIYARCCWRRRNRNRSLSRRHRVDLILAQEEANAQRNTGLDPSVIETLPIFLYTATDHPEAPLECAVCLCEFEEQEKGRLLPKCKHSFHIDCIDMWFASHSTCPLCRTSAQMDIEAGGEGLVQEESAQAARDSSEEQSSSPVYPTNVLFWGTENAVATATPSASASAPTESSSTKRLERIVIEVPRRESFTMRVFSPRGEEASPGGQNLKSPGSTRFRSIKRLLSREQRTMMSPSPRGNEGSCSGSHCVTEAESSPILPV